MKDTQTRAIATVDNLDHSITLDVVVSPQGVESYTVEYGHEAHTGLNYSQACKQFGACVLHSAQCMGLLDVC